MVGILEINKTVAGIVTINTFIGGVATDFATATSLAAKLAIDVNRITNFSIVGSDIQCRISGAYIIPNSAFNPNSKIIYYKDLDNLIATIGVNVFANAINFNDFKLEGITTITGAGNFVNTNLTLIYLPNLISVKASAFNDISLNQGKKTDIYIPKCTSLGDTVNTVENVFFNIKAASIIYAHPSLATINNGGVEADLADAISKGIVVRYVSNYSAPNAVTNLSSSVVYSEISQLLFSAPTGNVNTIDYYECYANGIYKNKITASGQYITGLTANTSYNITVIAVDIFRNKSLISNTVVITTSFNNDVAEAELYISAAAIADSGRAAAVRNLTSTLKNNGIFFKLKSLNIKAGTTAAQNKYNLIDARDLDAAYRYIYGGTWTHSNAGAKANGSNAFANTFFNLTTLGLGADFSAGYYLTVANTIYGDRHAIGAYSSVTRWAGLQHNSATQLIGMSFAGGVSALPLTNPNSGFFALSVNGNQKKIYHRANAITQTTNGTGIPSVNFYEGALNFNGSYYNGINATYGTSFFGMGLTESEIALLQSAIITFETALGRNV